MSSIASGGSWYEWLLGTRYLRSTQRRGFLSFISVVSMAGLAMGVAVLIVVLSVMNGFERELRARILSVTSHAQLIGLTGRLEDWHRAQQLAMEMPGVIAAVPYVDAQAMLSAGTQITATAVRGVLPAAELSAVGLAQRVTGGKITDLEPGSFRIVLGDALAAQLGVRVGDAVILMAPEGSATPAGIVPRMRRMTVAGLFHSGMYEYDSRLALMHIDDARRLYRLGDSVSGIRLALQDPFTAPATIRELALRLGGGYYTSDWTRVHAGFFESIQLSKSMLFVILLLLVAVAAFNIVATLVMVVKDKRADIAILRTLGAGPRNVLAAFAIQGALIGLIGTALGAALGWLIARELPQWVRAIERLFHTQFLDARVYFMSDLPTYVEMTDVLKITGIAFLLCTAATLYPAWRAAATQPAEALRHD
jgi:lipoprotein-releasing system permease protein